jgi:hypothetical protein
MPLAHPPLAGPHPAQDHGGPVPLDAYMRLPVREYSQLEPGMITALGGNTFLLKLPRIEVGGVAGAGLLLSTAG